MNFLYKPFFSLWGSPEIKLAAKVFLAAILMGAVFSSYILSSPGDLRDLMLKIYADIDKETLTFNNSFLYIFQRNSNAALLIIGLGLLHRYIPLFILSANGFFIGLIILTVIRFNLGVEKIFLLIPHGSIEIPALLLATAIGIKLTTRSKKFKERFIMLYKLRGEILVVFVMLFIAAIIESASIILFS